MRGPAHTVAEASALLALSPRESTSLPYGALIVIRGCMFSGKTTELIDRLRPRSRESIRVFKHVIDDRYRADAVVSHTGEFLPATPIASAGEMSAWVRGGIKVVAVDEAHFFEADLLDVVRQLREVGLTVIITSLDRDSWGRPFPIAERLCAIATEPVLRYAQCAQCDAFATRTQRLTPILNGSMVGGPESYEARCASCWHAPPETPPLVGKSHKKPHTRRRANPRNANR